MPGERLRSARSAKRARVALKRFRRKLLGFSFKVLLVSILFSSAITVAMCAGYVDAELLLRQQSLRRTAADMMRDAGLSPERVAALLSSDDYLITPGDPEALSPEQFAQIASGEGVVTGRFMGRRLYFDLGGRLMTVEAYPAANLLVIALLRSLLGNLIVVVVGFYVVYPLSRRMAQPIVHLSEATREVARGNFDIQVRMPLPRFGAGIREVAELTDNFNRMAHELKGVEYLRRDFTSNLSHELKSPVSSIRGYARLLQMEGLSDEQRREYAQAIAGESARLGSLSDNLLRLTRLEGHPGALAPEKFALDEQLRRCATALYPEIERKRQSIEVVLPRVFIEADRELLLQVWQNLLGNAIKFTPEGGRLRLSLEGGRAQVRVAVEDDGAGMDESTQARIFEKFFQGDPSRHTDGNGLGLPLVKRIVDLLGGTVEVKSSPGQGSRFTVTLPAAPPIPREEDLPA